MKIYIYIQTIYTNIKEIIYLHSDSVYSDNNEDSWRKRMET